MNRRLDELALPSSAAAALEPRARSAVAEELTEVVIALNEQASAWHVAGVPGLESAIVAVTALAERLRLRAQAYRT